jgi:lysozyme family protein
MFQDGLQKNKMALFAPAVENTELFEGGYSNSPSDSGGETYRGISRVWFPNWSGWLIVDPLKGGNFPLNLDNCQSLQEAVLQFYHTNFWQYDGITSQAIANKIFDLTVNVGKVHGIKIVQGAVNNCLPSAPYLTVDGVYGPNTEANIISTSSGSLLIAIKQAAVSYHKQIESTHPQDAIYLAGWIRRDES